MSRRPARIRGFPSRLARWAPFAFPGTLAIVRATFSGGLPEDSSTGDVFAFGEIQVITPAFAQTAAGAAGGVDMVVQLVPFILIFIIMYFLIIRPQQKKAKDHREMIKNVRRGDQIVTSGGLIGKVTKVSDENELELEIADGVRVRVARGMIADVRSKGEPVKA